MNDKTAIHFSDLVYDEFIRYIDDDLLECNVFSGSTPLGDTLINDMYGEVCLSHHVPFGNIGRGMELIEIV